MYESPKWTHSIINKIMYNPAGLLEPPPVIPGLRSSPWAGSWKIPKLTSPKEKKGILHSQFTSPAILMIHILSTPFTSSRHRRYLIRELNLLESIPNEYRHLIELKFVLGISNTKEGENGWLESREEEIEISKENKMFGDLIRLKLLENGENMNNGKSWEWLRYVGREGGREAWWVIKCDDDTLPLLPNLLPLLLSLDPSKPTYLGTSLGRWTGYHYYFQGMMYGFSWGVVKTMAVADVPSSTRNYNWDEDARMGEIMLSLPFSPKSNPTSKICSPPAVPDRKWSLPPSSPNLCTGLVSLDLGPKIGAWKHYLIDDERAAVAWHELKNPDEYIEAYHQAKNGFERRRKEYTWVAPKVFKSVAEI
ncbi:uncharacterized protein IL334_000722 [Kwoniella shivajii]|uniref:Hexosyltransferase n=1 Tax=Kwoniella shivajii TaxID=564305 RepID=A0ABZ1CQZ5_9TREE|nr:hypothetical protein IL334_000722 [Kwoniella shivajii]